jgi:tRNA(Ile)-lysidine synthase
MTIQQTHAESVAATVRRLLDRVRGALERMGPVRPGERVVVGVSGGPDSVVLLHLMAQLGNASGWSVHAAHFDHGLRGAGSQDDARFVQQLAEGWAIPLTLESAPPGSLTRHGRGLQAAAREARYAFFERVASATGARWVATGHTADDQAETVVMRWIRGGGATGLAGIPAVRGRFIRPLLAVSRAEIEAYLEAVAVTPRRDPSNDDPRFFRVAVRQTIIPALRALNPRAVETIGRAAGLLADDAAWLEACAEECLASLVRGAGEGWIELARAELGELHPALRRRVIRRALARIRDDATDVAFHLVESVCRRLAARSVGRIAIGRDLAADLGANLVRFATARAERPSPPSPVELPAAGERALPEWGLVVTVRCGSGAEVPRGPHEAAFDIDRLPGMLAVRSRAPGDVFFPEGMSGRKRLQDYFVDTRVPRWRRDRTPLLVAGGEVIWVIGSRRDRRYLAVAGTTSRSVVVTVCQGKDRA